MASTEAEQAPDPEPVFLNIVFRDQQNLEISFRLKPTTKLTKAMDVFSQRSGRERDHLRFLYDGERVLDGHTPNSFDPPMQDGDQVDVHMQQQGGGVDTGVRLTLSRVLSEM